jgi:cell division cycle protein 20 (cofactor of APC complex)
VYSVKWSTDGNYLASGDAEGSLFIWDARAGKNLEDRSSRSAKINLGGPIKVRL